MPKPKKFSEMIYGDARAGKLTESLIRARGRSIYWIGGDVITAAEREKIAQIRSILWGVKDGS